MTMTAQEKSAIADIFWDLLEAEGSNYPLNREEMKKVEKIHWSVLDYVKEHGQGHPKFPLIEKFFCDSTEKTEGSADCHNRQDWWTAFVKMLDDAKLYLSEEDRKELYQDLQSLIGFRLDRDEY